MIDLWTWQLSCGYHQFWLFYFLTNNIFIFFSDFHFISTIKHSSMVVLMKCSCSNTRWYQVWLDVYFSWKKSSNCHKFRQNVLPFHNQWKIWTLSVHSILMLWRPNLVRNCSIVYGIKWQTPRKLLKFYRTVGPVKAHLLLVLLKFYRMKLTKWQQYAEIFFGQ